MATFTSTNSSLTVGIRFKLADLIFLLSRTCQIITLLAQLDSQQMLDGETLTLSLLGALKIRSSDTQGSDPHVLPLQVSIVN